MKKILMTILAIILAFAQPAMAAMAAPGKCAMGPQKASAADVALQVAALLGQNLSVKDSGEPLDSKTASDFVAGARGLRDGSESWMITFKAEGCYSAQVSCFRRNDARHFVVHAISKQFPDGSYNLHSVKFYIFDGRKIMPVKDLPCSSPIAETDFTDGLGKHNFMSAGHAGANPAEEWSSFLKPGNMEYTAINSRAISVSPHNATQGHKALELAWNGDKFVKRQGSMQVIHSRDFAGIAIGSPFPNGIDLGNIKVAMINESVFMLKSGIADIARIDLKKGVIDCIIISAEGYTTPIGCGVGDKIDTQSANFVARQGNDTFIDGSGIMYRIDGNGVCREITIRNQ